jgi:hypothetical protein
MKHQMKHQRADDARRDLCKTSFGHTAGTGSEISLCRMCDHRVCVFMCGGILHDTLQRVNVKNDRRLVSRYRPLIPIV